MKKRLLTNKRIIAIYNNMPWGAKYGDVLKAVAEAEHAKTLKAIKGKLVHPPIAFDDIEIDDKVSVVIGKIMVQVRKYYQAIFDDAIGKE